MVNSKFLFPSYSSYNFSRLERVLAKLTTIHGASGFEKRVQSEIEQMWQPHTTKISKDNLGNLLAQINEYQPDKPTILIMAHMDEVGLLVSEVTPLGFILFETLGRWLTPSLLSQEWVISTGDKEIIGCSGIEAPHLFFQNFKEEKEGSFVNFIDIGAKSREEVYNLGIRPGLPITPNTKFRKLATHYLGKAFDDRAGLTVMSELLSFKSLTDKINLFFAATVQEEVGLRGAETIYNMFIKEYKEVKIDTVLNIDTGIADDFLTASKKNAYSEGITLNKGPSIFVFDRTMIPNQDLLGKLINTAFDYDIPFQYESRKSYGQDGAILQRAGLGLSSINIGIPTRYTHSSHSLLSQLDLYYTIKLLAAFIDSYN